MNQKKVPTKALHPRNKHINGYPFDQLIESLPELARFVTVNKYGHQSIDFAQADAVRMLNKALLKHDYSIDFWELPDNYLCPPIPGRADYIHYIADLLSSSQRGVIPTGKKIKGIDIGVGSNCVYPLIGVREYGWSFVGSDIDPVSVDMAKLIASSNRAVKGMIDIRLQSNAKNLFAGVVKPDEMFDFTLCNPPFHASEEEASAGSVRKLQNLEKSRTGKKSTKTDKVLNFGGQSTELWCEGGELKFVSDMVEQSVAFNKRVYWFTSLVSKKENLPAIEKLIKQVGAQQMKVINMTQGQKVSRFICWTFLDEEQRESWRVNRW